MTDKEKSYLDPDEDEEEQEQEEENVEGAEPSDEEEEEGESESEEEESEEEDDEKKKYGRRAEKRIRRLVQRRNELESQLVEREEKLRELEGKLSEKDTLYSETQNFATTQFEERLNAMAEALEREWYDAYEEGDQSKIWGVQKKLARVEAERMKFEDYKKREKVESKSKEDESEEEVQQQQVTQDQLHPKAVDWLKRNQGWFGTDAEMTREAIDIAKDLEQDGVGPDSDEHYAELDSQLREAFPDKFKSKSKQRVVGRSRTPAKRSSSKIKLSPADKARAERMNIPLDRYARELAKYRASQGA